MHLLPSSGAVLLSALAALSLSPAELARLEAAKNVGLAALEEGNLSDALKRFEIVRKLAPAEPLGWANGAVAAMRAKDLAAAQKLLAEAVKLAPGDARVLALEGARRELAGDAAGAVEAFERAAAAQPKDVASRWNAARLSADKGADSRRRAIGAVEAALAEAPSNLFLLLRLCEYARDGADAAKAAAAHERLAGLAAGDAKLDKALAEAKAALAANDAKTASIKYRIVENLLRAAPRYQQARHDVDPGVVGIPLEDWTPALAAKVRARSAQGVPVSFAPRMDAGLAALRGIAAVRVGGKDGRELVFAGEGGLRVASAAAAGFHVGAALPDSSALDVAVADVGNSGELDLTAPGALWVRGAEGYRKTALPPGERVVPLDFDSDGDLDVYVSSKSGDHLVRNNLDWTWIDVTAAAGIPAGLASRMAVAGDFDRDGDTDLVLVKVGGGIALLDNLRGGRFVEKEAGLPKSGAIRAAVAGDFNADGRLDLVWTTGEGAFVAVNRGDGTFLPARPLGGPGGVPLLFDYDNDGFLDLFVASPAGPSALFRGDGAGGFAAANVGALPAALDAAALDFDGDGDLDLALVTPAGGVTLLENKGGNANGWIDVALEGLPTGSAKVNRLGYGSEIEVKAQELYAYRVAAAPVTHVGLGARRKADVVRIVWTNGIPQNALNPPARTVLKEVQQLKGSCPFLYAFDGERWRFVTDALGRAPAGLLYDGVHQAAADTREWLVVPGESLRPKDGRLLLDFTEELWEAVYFDLAKLSALDHPAGVAIVSNEKMVPPPFPPKALFTVSRPLVPKATDERGRDRTQEIAAEDGRHLAGFAPTRYQGIVEPHDLVLELPEARSAKEVMLYLTGWIFYADTSINVSLSQRADLATFGPVLEVPDSRGGWKTAIPAMGYPAGKTKTMPVDLSQLLDRADPRVRIRTNLAIFWDRICYTADEPTAPHRLTPAPLLSADLFFRGYSRMTRETEDGPQVFVHDDVATAPRWADMAGLYTRFGDVKDLLDVADDRYVVMKGGDCVRFAFDATGLPPLPEGWVRDWLVVLDGWEKDADKNTVAGQTVLPLPFHGMDDARYGDPSQSYPDDEEHRRFRREYLTRRGGSEDFVDAIRKSFPSPLRGEGRVRGEPGVFRDITRASGIRTRVNGDIRRLKLIATMIGGCAFGDYDGDGLPDLYVTNGVARWGKPNGHNCGRLFKNLGGGRFADVTEKAGIRACGLGMGAFWVDLDGDGKLDLYLTNVGPNVVYWNRGDGTFEEGKDTGLEDPLFSVGAGFLDYDGDDRVDVVVANYLDTTPDWEAKQRRFELRVPEDYVGQPSHLFHNEGGRKWRDVTRSAGLAIDPRETKTLGVAVLDYDDDGRPDLYFVNDRVGNRLFRNRGDGTFEETTAETGAGVLGDHARAGMGVAVGDPFGDGLPSLFVTSFGAEPNSFYRNVEGTLFEDAGKETGTAGIGQPCVRWGTDFADFDNDGWPDLYAVGGHLAPRLVRFLASYKTRGSAYVEAGEKAYAQPSVLMRNLGGGRFEEWKNSGDVGKARMAARGTAVADIDNDGDLDLFVVDIDGPARLFENVVGSKKSWIRIEPRVGPDGRTVLGTRVTVTAGGRKQTREFYVSPSYASGSLTDVHFGLADTQTVDRVEITWPGGEKQAFEHVAARRVYRIRRGGALEPAGSR